MFWPHAFLTLPRPHRAPSHPQELAQATQKVFFPPYPLPFELCLLSTDSESPVSTWQCLLLFTNWCPPNGDQLERKALFLMLTEYKRALALEPIGSGLSPNSATWVVLGGLGPRSPTCSSLLLHRRARAAHPGHPPKVAPATD